MNLNTEIQLNKKFTNILLVILLLVLSPFLFKLLAAIIGGIILFIFI